MEPSDLPPPHPAADNSSDGSHSLADRLSELGRLFSSHVLSPAHFETLVHEIQERELSPNGRVCVVRTLENGIVRFIIKEADRVCDLIDCHDGDTPPTA